MPRIPPASSAENPSHSTRTSASRWELGSEANASSTSSRVWPSLDSEFAPTPPTPKCPSGAPKPASVQVEGNLEGVPDRPLHGLYPFPALERPRHRLLREVLRLGLVPALNGRGR